MESSLVNGKIPISYLYLKQFMLSHTAICTYTPEFLQHAVRVWFCLNNSSTLVWPHPSAAWCHTFFKRHQNKWSNCENVQEKLSAVLSHFRQEVSQASVPSAVLCHAERVLLAEHQIRIYHSSLAAPLRMTMSSLCYTKTPTKEESNCKSDNCRNRCILFGK